MTAIEEMDNMRRKSHELDSEFEHEDVPQSHRRRWFSVAAVWFGFPMILTNAVCGGIIVYGLGLGFARGLLAIALGNVALMLYVGALSYLAGVAWAVGAVAAAIVHYSAPAYAEAVVGLLAAGLAYTLLEVGVRRAPAEVSSARTAGMEGLVSAE